MSFQQIDLPVIYVVTPTYRRSEQIPELTRMAQTLLNVAAIHWIVVEDNATLSPVIARLLQRYGIPHTHLNGINIFTSIFDLLIHFNLFIIELDIQWKFMVECMLVLTVAFTDIVQKWNLIIRSVQNINP